MHHKLVNNLEGGTLRLPLNARLNWDAGVADWLASGAHAVIDERAAKYYE